MLSHLSWPTLCNSMNYSLTGNFVYGILQTRILEWVTIPFSRGSSRSRDQTQASMSPALPGGFYITAPPGKYLVLIIEREENELV